MITGYFLAGLILAAAIYFSIRLGYSAGRKDELIETQDARLAQQAASLAEKNKLIEELRTEPQVKRHTESTMSAVMDLTATSKDVVSEAVEARQALEDAVARLDYIRARAQATANIATVLAAGPEAYPIDPESGKRPRRPTSRRLQL